MSSWVFVCGRSCERAALAAARSGAAWGLAIAIGVGCTRQREEVTAPPPAPVAPAPPAEPAQPPAATPLPDYVPNQQHPIGWRGSRLLNAKSSELDPLSGETKKPRDFAAELTRMLGDASACVQPRARDASSAVSVALTAHVMPGGTVGRAEVEAAALQDAERACLRARAESLQFGPPIENAPFAVQASLSIRPKVIATPKPNATPTDALGMSLTQAPSGPNINPGVVPPEVPGVVPPEVPGVVPPADPGVPIEAVPGVVPTPDPPAEVLPALGTPNK